MASDGSERRKPLDVFGFLFNELRHAFQDARQKVIEEGWFGRVVTAKPVHEVHRDIIADAMTPADRTSVHDILGECRPTFDELWKPREQAERARAQGHEMDIER